MAKYKRRKDGMFYTLVNSGKYDEAGRPIRISVYGHSSKELEVKVGEIKTGLKQGTYADDGKLCFGEYSLKWLKTYKENTVEKSTYLKYKTTVEKHMTNLEYIRLMDLSKSDIQQQINLYPDSYDTRRLIKLVVGQILESAIDDGLLYRNVSKQIKVPVPVNTNSNRRALTDKEKEVIKKLKEEHVFTTKESFYISTLFATGIRPGEMLALTRSDFDMKHHVLHINKSLTWAGGKKVKPPKTKNSIRDIELPSWYLTEVNEYLPTLSGFNIFPDENGDLMSGSTHKRFWSNLFNKINLAMGGTPDVYKSQRLVNRGIKATDLTPYIFRHNYATMLYYGGFDLKEASRLLGHSNIKLTLEIYTHLASKKSTIKEKLNQIAL